MIIVGWLYSMAARAESCMMIRVALKWFCFFVVQDEQERRVAVFGCSFVRLSSSELIRDPCYYTAANNRGANQRN